MTRKMRRMLAGIAFAAMLAVSMSVSADNAWANPPTNPAPSITITVGGGGGFLSLGVTWED